jgi:HAD superfamily hydrolase (TIGR01509 family)
MQPRPSALRPSAYDLLICDCDGVLVDSEIIADRVLLETISRLYPGRGAETALAHGFGTQTEVLLARVAAHLGEALPASFPDDLRREMEATLAREAEPIRDIRSALEAVGLPIAVVSNSPEGRVRNAIRRAGLDHLIGDHIYTADQVAHPKPAPDVYLLAARSLQVAPERCIVIEDSGPGVTAATAAGMSVIGFIGASHIPAGHDAKLLGLGAGHILQEMRLLPQVIADLDRRPSAS